MGEIAIVNGRRRSHKKKSKKGRHHRRARAARNPHLRRPGRRHIRRARRNPGFSRAGLLSGLNVAGGLVTGIIATNLATGAVLKYVPGVPAQMQTGLGRTALKLGIGVVALPMLINALSRGRSGPRSFASNVRVGAWASVILELYETYVKPKIGFADYEFMTGYQELGPENTPLGELIEGDGMSGGENIYSDTMYGYGR